MLAEDGADARAVLACLPSTASLVASPAVVQIGAHIDTPTATYLLPRGAAAYPVGTALACGTGVSAGPAVRPAGAEVDARASALRFANRALVDASSSRAELTGLTRRSTATTVLRIDRGIDARATAVLEPRLTDTTQRRATCLTRGAGDSTAATMEDVRRHVDAIGAAGGVARGTLAISRDATLSRAARAPALTAVGRIEKSIDAGPGAVGQGIPALADTTEALPARRALIVARPAVVGAAEGIDAVESAGQLPVTAPVAVRLRVIGGVRDAPPGERDRPGEDERRNPWRTKSIHAEPPKKASE